jgi:hypothetical protein
MGIKSTHVLLKKIIRLVIGTGTVTGTHLCPSFDVTNEKSITLIAAIAIINLVCAVLAVLPSHPFYFTTQIDVMAKVYSNSMMVVLNNRMKIDTDVHPETNTTVTRLHSDNLATHGTDAFELDEGVLVTREEMVFACNPDKVHGTG